jgi:rfaE bifunctional protein nucleotidyltransferase chain/domain
MGKLKSRDEIARIGEELRKKGKKIVTVNGSFDILHIGHIRMLQEAKMQGDVLIVGLNSDASIKQYKSKDRPINPAWARAGMLEAMECVDYITIFNETDPRKLLEVIKPDVHVNGPEWGGKECIEADVVRKHGGKVYVSHKVEGFSTTKMIEKIVNVYGKKKC